MEGGYSTIEPLYLACIYHNSCIWTHIKSVNESIPNIWLANARQDFQYVLGQAEQHVSLIFST